MITKVRVATRGTAGVLVLAHYKGYGLSDACATHDADGSVAEALDRAEVTGDAGAITEAFPAHGAYERVIVVGLGEFDAANTRAFRAAGAAAGRRLDAIGAPRTEVCLAGPIREAGLDEHECAAMFAEAIGLMTFDHEAYKGSATPKATRHALDLLVSDLHAASFASGIQHGLAMAESINVTRALSMAPPNELNPVTLATAVQRIARQAGLGYSLIEGDDLLEHGLVGIHNVGMASETPGCLIRLEYTPPGRSRAGKPLVLVGKTITYDSGGLSLKINNNMRGMKQDMDGGAAVVGAMHAIATAVRPKRRVVAYLAAAENSVSDEAYRPDDVLVFANGVSVEVTNTDAEGRLVLADALVYACDHDDPAGIVDIATLTGGVVVALGRHYAGLWSHHDTLRTTVLDAGEKTGERCWHLPMGEEYRKMMRSDVADIWNSAPVREAHAIQGAAFLSFFVHDAVPWAQLDIAGAHNANDDSGVIAKGTPPGFGARLLAEIADRY